MIVFLLSGGIDNIEINMEKQQVYVTSTLSADELLETIKKAGKPCSYIGTAWKASWMETLVYTWQNDIDRSCNVQELVNCATKCTSNNISIVLF